MGVGSQPSSGNEREEARSVEAGLSQGETAGQLLDPQARDRTADHQLLDLLRSLKEVHELSR
jgi:hypothetical protein